MIFNFIVFFWLLVAAFLFYALGVNIFLAVVFVFECVVREMRKYYYVSVIAQ